MSIRNVLRYTGLMLIVAIFIVSGLFKITDPGVGAAMLAQSNFPHIVSLAGVQLDAEQYRLIIQATGVIFVSFSLFILLGVGRSFFAFLLAMGTVFITVCFFVDLDDPLGATVEKQQRCMSNLAIVGGFLFIAGSGTRSRQYAQARERAAQEKKKNK